MLIAMSTKVFFFFCIKLCDLTFQKKKKKKKVKSSPQLFSILRIIRNSTAFENVQDYSSTHVINQTHEIFHGLHGQYWNRWHGRGDGSVASRTPWLVYCLFDLHCRGRSSCSREWKRQRSSLTLAWRAGKRGRERERRGGGLVKMTQNTEQRLIQV